MRTSIGPLRGSVFRASGRVERQHRDHPTLAEQRVIDQLRGGDGRHGLGVEALAQAAELRVDELRKTFGLGKQHYTQLPRVFPPQQPGETEHQPDLPIAGEHPRHVRRRGVQRLSH